MKFLPLVLALLIASAGAAAAPTRYVTEELEITLRSGPTTSHRIVKMLVSGSPLEVLENLEDGWSRVRTRDGTEGWVLTRYLVNTPSARDRLEAASGSFAKAQQDLQAVKQNLAAESQRLAEARAQVAELSTANERMKQQLSEAGRGLALSEENKDLRKQVVDLQREIETLQNETARLRDRSERDWFVAGAAVFFGAFLVGIVVTRIRWRRKSSWSSL